MHGNPSAPANRPVAQANVGPEADDRLAYSVNEAAERLGVGPMTLYREIAEGKLPAIRIRDRVLVPKVVLERLVEEAISRATGTGSPTSGGDARCGMTPGRRFRLVGIARRTRRRSPAPATSSWPSASAPPPAPGRWCGPPGRPPAWPSATPGWSSPPADVAHVLWHLPQHWSDPALAWPAEVRGPLPGPAGMYATFAGAGRRPLGRDRRGPAAPARAGRPATGPGTPGRPSMPPPGPAVGSCGC